MKLNSRSLSTRHHSDNMLTGAGIVLFVLVCIFLLFQLFPRKPSRVIVVASNAPNDKIFRASAPSVCPTPSDSARYPACGKVFSTCVANRSKCDTCVTNFNVCVNAEKKAQQLNEKKSKSEGK